MRSAKGVHVASVEIQIKLLKVGKKPERKSRKNSQLHSCSNLSIKVAGVAKVIVRKGTANVFRVV